MRTGQWIGIRFTRTDGSNSLHGSWKVPHDSEYALLEQMGDDLGWVILHELARQDPLEATKVEVIPWEERHEPTVD